MASGWLAAVRLEHWRPVSLSLSRNLQPDSDSKTKIQAWILAAWGLCLRLERRFSSTCLERPLRWRRLQGTKNSDRGGGDEVYQATNCQ